MGATNQLGLLIPILLVMVLMIALGIRRAYKWLTLQDDYYIEE